MRVFLLGGFASEPSRYRLENGLISGREGIRKLLVRGAVAGSNELHHGDGCDSCGGDQIDHGPRLADIGTLDIKACRLERVEVLLNGPPHPIQVDDPTRLSEAGHFMGGQESPVDWLAFLRF